MLSKPQFPSLSVPPSHCHHCEATCTGWESENASSTGFTGKCLKSTTFFTSPKHFPLPSVTVKPDLKVPIVIGTHPSQIIHITSPIRGSLAAAAAAVGSQVSWGSRDPPRPRGHGSPSVHLSLLWWNIWAVALGMFWPWCWGPYLRAARARFLPCQSPLEAILLRLLKE